jgi:hypothetical protein
MAKASTTLAVRFFVSDENLADIRKNTEANTAKNHWARDWGRVFWVIKLNKNKKKITTLEVIKKDKSFLKLLYTHPIPQMPDQIIKKYSKSFR